MLRLSLLILLALAVSSFAEDRWFKGNTHTHTLWSDGDDFPEMSADWYREHGYDFLALSDHNVLHAKEVWMSVAKVEARRKTLGKPTMDKYRARFGNDWVITREVDGQQEVRLRQLEEYRPKLESPGKFLLIPAEEISAKFEKAPIHIGAVNMREVIEPVKAGSIAEVIGANLRAVNEQSQRLGVPMFAHLNHPNFQWAITAEDMAQVPEERFFEVFNGHHLVHNEGDASRASTERLWDIANTLRLAQHKAPILYGVGTDDTHNYHGADSKPGRGWVMVRAPQLEAAAIVTAMQRGDFYASSGVTLESLTFVGNVLSIHIRAQPGVTYTTQFIGTPRGTDLTAKEEPSPKGDPHPTRKHYSAEVGKVFATAEGAQVSYRCTGQELFVRATITASTPHPSPVWEGQKQQAWVQPVQPLN